MRLRLGTSAARFLTVQGTEDMPQAFTLKQRLIRRSLPQAQTIRRCLLYLMASRRRLKILKNPLQEDLLIRGRLSLHDAHHHTRRPRYLMKTRMKLLLALVHHQLKARSQSYHPPLTLLDLNPKDGGTS